MSRGLMLIFLILNIHDPSQNSHPIIFYIIDIHAAGMNMDGPFVIEPVSIIHRDLKEEKY